VLLNKEAHFFKYNFFTFPLEPCPSVLLDACVPVWRYMFKYNLKKKGSHLAINCITVCDIYLTVLHA